MNQHSLAVTFKVAGWEAGANYAQEGGGHVGLDPLVEWWIEPNNSFAAASPPRLVGSLLCPGWDVNEL